MYNITEMLHCKEYKAFEQDNFNSDAFGVEKPKSLKGLNHDLRGLDETLYSKTTGYPALSTT